MKIRAALSESADSPFEIADVEIAHGDVEKGYAMLAEAAIRDVPFREMDLARFVNQRYPGRPLYVAAFPNHGYARIYYFSGPQARRRPKIDTRYHSSLLLDLNRGEKYVYVMIFPELFEKPFREADPRGKFFRFSNGYATFAN